MLLIGCYFLAKAQDTGDQLVLKTTMGQIKESNIENLVFQGIGTRAVALIGALQALSDNGNFNNIKRVNGVSSGSIVALLYALEYTPEQMRKIFSDTDFGSLEDRPNIFRVKKKFGYFKGKKLENLLRKFIGDSKLNLDEDATFSDLYEKKGTELYLFAANLNTYSIEEFSYRKTPNVKLWEIVRASISIPLVFPAWKFTQGVKNDHLYVDGGIIYDFPINFFDYKPFNSSGNGINHKTLGFMIDNSAIDRKEQTLNYGSSFKDYLTAIYSTSVDGQISVIKLNPNESERIIVIKIDGDISFSLTDAQKKDLYNRGYNYTNMFLKKNDGKAKKR